MGQNALVQIQGAIVASPVVPQPGGPGLQEVASLVTRASYAASKSSRPTIQNTLLSPFVVPLEGIVKVRIFFVAVLTGGSLIVTYSSPNGGDDQLLPVSDKLLLHNPNPGDELTAIAISGNADIVYFIAGDQG